MPSEIAQAMAKLRAKKRKVDALKARVKRGSDGYIKRFGKNPLLSGSRKKRAKVQPQPPDGVREIGALVGPSGVQKNEG